MSIFDSRWRAALLLAATLSTAGGIAGVARAAPATPQTRELAVRLADLLLVDEQVARMRQQCLRAQEAMSPSVLVEKNPDYFGGLRPGHVKWGRLVAAYKLYVQQVCARPTREEYRDLIVQSYAASLTPEQLRSATQFFGTPSGKALATAFNQSALQMTEEMTSAIAPHLASATAQYQGEIGRLMASP